MASPSPVLPSVPSSPAPPLQPRRRSVAGPMVLIALGIVFLLGTMGLLHWGPLLQWFGHYWPLLIIFWGVVKLLEHQRAQREGARAPGIGAGGVFLLIVLIMFGLAATQISRVNWGELRGEIPWNDSDFQLFGHTYSYDDQLSQAFPAGATLRVTSDHGAIQVNATDDDQIRVAVHKRVNAESQQDADKWNAGTKPQISVSDHTVTLNANTQGAGDHWVATDLNISLPRKAAVVISTHRGDISVLGRDGDVDLSSQRGDTSASDINGGVSVNMRHGSARVSKVAADVAVQGAGDDVSLQEIKGAARISGEFDSIKLARIAKAVSFKSARTDLEFARLDGDLDMDTGDMRASDLIGPFRLLTRSKDIRLTGVSGDVRLQNENGAVEVHMNKLGSMEVSNRNSEIEVYLPDKAGFQIDARVRGGEVESDFKDLKIENGDDNGSATGTVGGGGPRLVLNSEHGTISIHKGLVVAEAPAPPHAPKAPHPPGAPEETEN